MVVLGMRLAGVRTRAVGAGGHPPVIASANANLSTFCSDPFLPTSAARTTALIFPA
jgi:hypothetical protein